MTLPLRHHRDATAYNVTPIRADLYDKAYRAALDAGADWPAMLGYAQTLSHSPLPAHTRLASHIRMSYSQHLAGLLNPVNPTHRDRSDRVDQWKAEAIRCEDEETPLRVAMRHRKPLLACLMGVLLACLAAVAFGAVL